jgi:hypothetical protein
MTLRKDWIVSRAEMGTVFKHEATAAFLLEHGMDPNHMNWHRFTLASPHGGGG